jgi:UDP-N-acetylmuramate--alanine ligase
VGFQRAKALKEDCFGYSPARLRIDTRRCCQYHSRSGEQRTFQPNEETMSGKNRRISMAMAKPRLHLTDLPDPGRAHLIGIAGTGMRSLAAVLLQRGWHVAGSDPNADSVQYLSADGATIYSHHSAEHLSESTDLVVHSDAIGDSNPELDRAGKLDLPVMSYFQVLGQMMHARRGLAIAGTHGKSTVSAMTAEILTAANLDPTIVYGAQPLNRNCGGRSGSSDLMLVEACEYRANFLHLRPLHAVITGIEPDHFDCYRSEQDLQHAFALFVRNVPPEGLVLARSDCPATLRVTASGRCPVETFGLQPGDDWSAEILDCHNARYAFQIHRHGRKHALVKLRVPGQHNVLNALAAAAISCQNGVSAQTVSKALGRFRGLRRRLEEVGSWGGVLLLDDYAHHPTEVTATLKTIRQMYPRRRIWCLFQPHQASRTAHLLDETAKSLQNADKVSITHIFRAREPEYAPGDVTAADLAELVRSGGTQVGDGHSINLIQKQLENELRPGDVLITLGAGDIRKICDGFVDRLRKNRSAG